MVRRDVETQELQQGNTEVKAYTFQGIFGTCVSSATHLNESPWLLSGTTRLPRSALVLVQRSLAMPLNAWAVIT